MNPILKQAKQIDPPLSKTEVTPKEKEQLNQSKDQKKNQGNDQEIPKPQKKISLQQIINKLNHLNFEDLNIKALFQHNKYPRALTLQAIPMPCSSEHFTCRWHDAIDIEQIMMSYHFHCIHIPSEHQVLEVFPELKSISESEALFTLPASCTEINTQESHRYQCAEATAFMFQNGVLFHGRLLEYGAFQFRIVVRKLESQNYHWLNMESPVTVVFTRGNETLYSGQCRIVKHDYGAHRRQISLEPIMRQIRRFEPLSFRSYRQFLNPSLDAVFRHPLFDKSFNFKVINISGSGFAVHEEKRSAVLLPGLVIPNLKLSFGDGSSIQCTAQVIYTKPHSETPSSTLLRCGLVILDMPVEDHIKLLALLHQADDANAYLCNKVDMHALWDFFFETGFIYPKKYEFIKENKAKIKETYEKLYHHSPSIASHFIYQDNGRISAHMAMIRFYDESWLIHHHAADRSANHKGGLMVLSQIARFINDSHRLSSMKMDYVFCYYRPDNKFPNHVFGGSARNIKDSAINSLDNFAYLHLKVQQADSDAELSDNWQLAPATRENLEEFESFYNDHSGGLMIRGLQLTPGKLNIGDLISTYRKIGLKRGRHLFALNHNGKMSALVMVNVADLGLNMSDLTNSVQFFVVNGQNLTGKIVHSTVKAVSAYLEINDIPVLIYPRQAATEAGLEYEKTYCLWIYNLHRTMDPFYGFIKRILKFIKS